VSDQDRPQELAEPREVAEFLHTSEEALAQGRYRGTGPQFVKHGRRVLYRWIDVHEYLDANTVKDTSERGRRAATAVTA
jgi:hypothetical protein